jgi:hypothetical protein
MEDGGCIYLCVFARVCLVYRTSGEERRREKRRILFASAEEYTFVYTPQVHNQSINA